MVNPSRKYRHKIQKAGKKDRTRRTQARGKEGRVYEGTGRDRVAYKMGS